MILLCSDVSGIFIWPRLKPKLFILTKTFFPSLIFYLSCSLAFKDLFKYTRHVPSKDLFFSFCLHIPLSNVLWFILTPLGFLSKKPFLLDNHGPPILFAFCILLTLLCFLSPHLILHMFTCLSSLYIVQ